MLAGRALLPFENQILRMIARGDPIQETMRQLCVCVEETLPEVLCSIIAVDRAGLLRPLAGPSLPEDLVAAVDGALIGPDAGSCGTAAYLGVPVTADDIEHDAKWTKYKHLALPLGLKACWSLPICEEGGAVIGVAALYFREVRGPRAAERATMAVCMELCEMSFRRHERILDRERRANVDALTGLPNRAAFNVVLSGLPCADAGSWALFVIDLDNLKVVNDTFGHQAGDGLIQIAAARIAASLAPDVTFRLGGDEFAVVIQSREALLDLDATAVRVFDSLEIAADCAGHMIVPKATIGGAVLGKGDAPKTVNQNADFALYHAKETGRGGFVRYWPGIGTRITHRREAIRDLAAALKEGRIDAYYQPIVRLDSKEIVGVEALCRLRTPSGEIVAAEAFQEATADAHLAAELTEQMLSIVAQDVRSWLDAGLPFQLVGVNISTSDFHVGDLVGKVERCFAPSKVPLDHLILEVKEDAYMNGRDHVIAREIKAMRAKGLRVALDGFGMGYASLTRLVGVPVDAIKIDRSFVARLWPDDPSMVIVEGLIDIARKLDIRVVAEGIESQTQASQLWAMGCRLGQGFAFSKAVDRTEATKLLCRHGQWVAGAIPLEANCVSRRTDVPLLRPTGTD